MIYSQAGYSLAEAWIARFRANAKAIRMEDIARLPNSERWMPVGSVEFCLAAMRHQGIKEPAPIDYPECLQAFQASVHRLVPYGEIAAILLSGKIHAKPAQTKLSESQWEQETPFLVADWHSFWPEYRVYVLFGEILGIGRYDNLETEQYPDMGCVQEMVSIYQKNGAPAGYGLDVGISVRDGRTYLVEVNDGWALGYYKGSCSEQDYLRLIEARWEEIADRKGTS